VAELTEAGVWEQRHHAVVNFCEKEKKLFFLKKKYFAMCPLFIIRVPLKELKKLHFKNFKNVKQKFC
jgi:hypothetical protein